LPPLPCLCSTQEEERRTGQPIKKTNLLLPSFYPFC
jgi:hypothetical protein